jgi:branched-subunit amino acid ABC-type transport system permease component
MSTLVTLIIAVCILIVAWFVIERFSPDPLITKICQIIIFVIALLLIVQKLLAMVGVSF